MRVEQAIPRPISIRPHRSRLRRWLSMPASVMSLAWRWMTGDRPGYIAADTDMWLLVMAASDCDGTWLAWPPQYGEPHVRSLDDESNDKDDLRRDEPLRLPRR